MWEHERDEPTLTGFELFQQRGAAIELDRYARGWKIGLAGTSLDDEDVLLQFRDKRQHNTSVEIASDADDAAIDESPLEKLFPVVEIDLSDTLITDKSIWELVRLRWLEVFELGGTKITDAALLAISSLEHLESLGVGETVVTDQGMEHVSRLGNLWCVDLDGTAITDRGLARLVTLSRLEWLFLSRTNVTDSALRTLCQFPRLEHLTLNESRVTSYGYDQLKRHLPGCQIEWSVAS